MPAAGEGCVLDVCLSVLSSQTLLFRSHTQILRTGELDSKVKPDLKKIVDDLMKAAKHIAEVHCVKPAEEVFTQEGSSTEQGTFESLVAEHHGEERPIAKAVLGQGLEVGARLQREEERGEYTQALHHACTQTHNSTAAHQRLQQL